MSRTIDVIVVGSGLAGLTAALASAGANRKTAVISQGMGSLGISPGCIDLLGYDRKGALIKKPWSAFDSLPPDHPYSLLGMENVKAALKGLGDCLASQGYPMHCARDEYGEETSTLMPTIMGTLKPTFLVPAELDPAVMEKARRVLVVSVAGFRDCRPRLIINQLLRYKTWADRELVPLTLPEPFKEHGRSINALDIAHAADRAKGRDWLLNELKDRGRDFDLVLMPPVLGARASSGIRKAVAEALGCPYAEMLSIPPGVSGLRLRDALVSRLDELGVEFMENAEVVRADVRDSQCASLTVLAAGRETTRKANAFVIATGGILSGGITLSPGKACESIFGFNLPVPENVDEWSEPAIFGRHLVARLGVKVDSRMRALNENGVPYLKNVFFAGRTIGGYDYASEKSGHGVAAATGWQAGRMAAGHGEDRDHNAAGAQL